MLFDISKKINKFLGKLFSNPTVESYFIDVKEYKGFSRYTIVIEVKK